MQKEPDHMIGKLEAWDEDAVLKVVEMLVHSDEVERALLVLDNVPAIYRDQPTFRMVQMRRDILAAMTTPHAYMIGAYDPALRPDDAKAQMQWLLRGRLIEAEVRRYNKFNQVPHIVDVGPGEYIVPLGLKACGLKFTYKDIAMDLKTQSAAKQFLADYQVEPTQDQPRIFLANEIIEHLPEPRDLLVESHRHCARWPERVHISTPCYTFDGRIKEWRKEGGLPHLRAYTPFEFQSEVRKLFPMYKWEFHLDLIMSLVGYREDKIPDEPLIVEKQQ